MIVVKEVDAYPPLRVRKKHSHLVLGNLKTEYGISKPLEIEESMH